MIFPAQAPFDLVLCRHVLEHTYNPVEFLKGVHDLMRPGGVLLLEVPNLDAPLRRLFGKYWDGYYVPYHPIHFSSAALQRVAVNAGFVPDKFGGCEMPKIGRSLRNMIGCSYNSALFAVGVLLHPLQFAARFLTGQPTCLRLWARKPEQAAEKLEERKKGKGTSSTRAAKSLKIDSRFSSWRSQFACGTSFSAAGSRALLKRFSVTALADGDVMS